MWDKNNSTSEADKQFSDADENRRGTQVFEL